METIFKKGQVKLACKAQRPVFSSWKGVRIPHGIPPTRVPPTPFLDKRLCPGWKNFWRDIPSKQSINESVDRFFEKKNLHLDVDTFDKAFNKVRSLFIEHFGIMDLVSVDHSLRTLPSDTSAGLPFATGVTKGQSKNLLKRLAKAQWRRAASHKRVLFSPCRAGVRRQLRERGTNKPRLIWAYPGYVTVLENQFSRPFLEKESPSFLGWSINWLDQGRSLERIKYRCGWHSLSHIDFSSYDSSVPGVLIRAAFEVIRDCFNFDETQKVMFKELIDYFIHTPLVCYNSIITKHRGIPSGSAFTQLVGSICNMIACYYSSFRSSAYGIVDSRSCWLGDDSLIYYDEGMAKEEFNDLFLVHFEDFGLSVSVEKTGYCVNHPVARRRGPIKFLGREIVSKGVIQYDTNKDRLSAQAVWPEEPDRTKYDVAARLIGLVWAYGMYRYNYEWLKLLFKSLHIKVGSKIIPRRGVVRFVELFVGHGIDLTSFPDFYSIESRYFGPINKFETLESNKESWINYLPRLR